MRFFKQNEVMKYFFTSNMELYFFQDIQSVYQNGTEMERLGFQGLKYSDT